MKLCLLALLRNIFQIFLTLYLYVNQHGVHDKMMPVPIWTSSGGKQPAAASFAGTLPSSGAGRPVVLVPAGLGANVSSLTLSQNLHYSLDVNCAPPSQR